MADNQTPTKETTVTAPKIVLSQTAPWNPTLRNGYRDRYTEVGGRYFKISADALNAPWWVQEVNADGSLTGELTTDPTTGELGWAGGFTEIVFTLAEARDVIAAETITPEQADAAAVAYAAAEDEGAIADQVDRPRTIPEPVAQVKEARRLHDAWSDACKAVAAALCGVDIPEGVKQEDWEHETVARMDAARISLLKHLDAHGFTGDADLDPRIDPAPRIQPEPPAPTVTVQDLDDPAGLLASAAEQGQAATDKYETAASIPLADRKGARRSEYRALIAGAKLHENAARYLREAHAAEGAKAAIGRADAFARQWPKHPSRSDRIYGLEWMDDFRGQRVERSAELTIQDLNTIIEFARKAVGQ